MPLSGGEPTTVAPDPDPDDYRWAARDGEKCLCTCGSSPRARRASAAQAVHRRPRAGDTGHQPRDFPALPRCRAQTPWPTWSRGTNSRSRADRTGRGARPHRRRRDRLRLGSVKAFDGPGPALPVLVDLHEQLDERAREAARGPRCQPPSAPSRPCRSPSLFGLALDEDLAADPRAGVFPLGHPSGDRVRQLLARDDEELLTTSSATQNASGTSVTTSSG